VLPALGAHAAGFAAARRCLRFLVLFLVGSVRQIKLDTRQLLGAR